MPIINIKLRILLQRIINWICQKFQKVLVPKSLWQLAVTEKAIIPSTMLLVAVTLKLIVEPEEDMAANGAEAVILVAVRQGNSTFVFNEDFVNFETIKFDERIIFIILDDLIFLILVFEIW